MNDVKVRVALVLGATGNIGRTLVGELDQAGMAVRALTRDPARAAGLPDGVEVVQGDLERPETVEPALRGADALFLLLEGPDDKAPLLRRAREAGVRRVVLVSSLVAVIRPDTPIGQSIRAAEQAVRDSGMAWTILRPGQFASNTLWWADQIRGTGTVRAPFAGAGLPSVHPADIAAVARVALTEDGLAGRIVPLTGPAPVTPPEQVRAIGRAIGRDLAFEEVTRDQAHAQMAGFMPAEVADAVLDLLEGRDGDNDPAWRTTVEEVTGAPARTFQEWAYDNADAFGATAVTRGEFARLQERIGGIEDRAAIAELIDRYLLSLDERRFDDEWARAFHTEDFRARTPVGEHEGQAGAAEGTAVAIGRFDRTQHIGSNYVIGLDGDRADVQWNALMVHVHLESTAKARGQEFGTHFDVGGRFEGEAVRTADGWRFRRMDVKPVWFNGQGPIIEGPQGDAS